MELDSPKRRAALAWGYRGICVLIGLALARSNVRRPIGWVMAAFLSGCRVSLASGRPTSRARRGEREGQRIRLFYVNGTRSGHATIAVECLTSG